MEHFYKGHPRLPPYWHGGMKDDETTWVSLQVPDGTGLARIHALRPNGKDNISSASMNHIALGVHRHSRAQEQLRKKRRATHRRTQNRPRRQMATHLYEPDELASNHGIHTGTKTLLLRITAPHPKP